MKTIDLANTARNKLRVLQASQWTDTYPHINKMVSGLILSVTWRVAERLSGERLPR